MYYRENKDFRNVDRVLILQTSKLKIFLINWQILHPILQLATRRPLCSELNRTLFLLNWSKLEFCGKVARKNACHKNYNCAY